MRERRLFIVIIVAFLYSTACTFSTKLPTPTPPTAAPEQQPTRPQTTFIDARTVKNDSPVSSDTSPGDAEALPLDTNADSSGGGNTSAGEYGSGGYYGGGYHNGYYGSWGGYYGYYGWYCTPSYDWAYTYWVQWGDTLNNIGWRSGTTWQALAQANCIPDPNRIYVGQVLRVPQPVAPLYTYPHYPHPHYPIARLSVSAELSDADTSGRAADCRAVARRGRHGADLRALRRDQQQHGHPAAGYADHD